MKENEKIGQVVGKNCGRICLAAFTLALLAGMPSCTNDTSEEAVNEESASYQQQNAGTGQTPSSEKHGVAKKTGQTAVKIPENQLHTIESSKSGYIMLSGGEIVSPEYLSTCTTEGFEPIGIICFRIKEKKILLGIDAFYEQEAIYGWGSAKELATEFQQQQATFNSPKGNTSYPSLKTGSTQYSYDSNNKLLKAIKRESEQKNIYLDYIANYASTHKGLPGDLSWEAPSVFEGYIIYCNKSKILGGLNGIVSYFKNTNDSRAKALEKAGGLISDKKYVLTSNTGEGNNDNDSKHGVWAFIGLDREGGTLTNSKYMKLTDGSNKSCRSYQFRAQDLITYEYYQLEYVLAKENTDGYAAMAISHLN